MYGWLVSEKGGLIAQAPNWYFTQRELTLEEAKDRGSRAMAFASKLSPVELKNRVFLDLAAVNKAVHPESIDYAWWMCLAHHRLPDGERQAREKRIASIVDDHLCDLSLEAQKTSFFTDKVKSLKRCAIVVPDALLECTLKVHCSEIWSALSKERPAYTVNRSITALMAMEPGDAYRPLARMLFSCSRAEYGGRFVPALDLGARKRTDVVIEASKRGEALLDKINAHGAWRRVALDDAIAEIVRDAVQGERPKDWGDIIDAPLRRMVDLHAVQQNQIFWASVAAVEAGTEMGDKTAGSRNALKAWKQQIFTLTRRMTMERLRETRKIRSTGKAPVSKPPTEALDDLDPVSSWSVGRLAQWIEGPLADLKAKPIDRKAILSKEQVARNENPSPKITNQPQDPPLEAEDVAATIRDALSATAEFFLAELRDLLALAKQLKVEDAVVIHPCQVMLVPLSEFAQKPYNDDAKARQMLGQAELHIEALRAKLKTVKASAQVQARFPQALSTALSNEPVVLGKRQGRVIDCKVQPEDWIVVNESFHRRWLPQFRQILVEGQSVPLGLNEALALHVTGSSRSGYAFDVSVHLWHRRAGSNALPSLEKGVLYPRMDEAHWFDTHTPCCVLHVPPAD